MVSHHWGPEKALYKSIGSYGVKQEEHVVFNLFRKIWATNQAIPHSVNLYYLDWSQIAKQWIFIK